MVVRTLHSSHAFFHNGAPSRCDPYPRSALRPERLRTTGRAEVYMRVTVSQSEVILALRQEGKGS